MVVVEAKVRSGALITADHALDLGRDVLAVPGWPAFAGAGGTNALLKAGAGLIESVEDLQRLAGARGAGAAGRRRRSGAGRPARRSRPIPTSWRPACGSPPAALSAALARLELAGEICRDPHGRWMPGSAARAR